MEWEDAQWVPHETFLRCGELGFLGLKYEEKYGGQGGTYLHDAVWAEELARCGSGGGGAAIGGGGENPPPPPWEVGPQGEKKRRVRPGGQGGREGGAGRPQPPPR